MLSSSTVILRIALQLKTANWLRCAVIMCFVLLQLFSVFFSQVFFKPTKAST